MIAALATADNAGKEEVFKNCTPYTDCTAKSAIHK